MSLLFFALLFLAPFTGRSEVIYFDDFTSSTAGSPPLSSKWTRVGSSGSIMVRDQTLHTSLGSPEKFLRLSGTSLSCTANVNIPVTGVVTAQFHFFEPSNFHNPGQTFLFGFGRNNELNASNAGLAFSLRDGVLSAISGTTGLPATYLVNRAYSVTIIFNRSASAISYPFQNEWYNLPAGNAHLWLTDTTTQTHVQIGTYIASVHAPNANQFLFRIFSATPGNTVDVDDVFIHDTMQMPNWTDTWRSKYFEHYWQPPTGTNFHTDAFLQDFSYAGYKMRMEGYPSTSPTGGQRTVYNVTLPPYNADKTGVNDSTNAIQWAINDAGANPNGGIVFLPSGTYRVSPQGSSNHALLINFPNVVLRGSGVSATRIYNSSTSMRGKQVIRIEGPSLAAHLYEPSSPSLSVNITSDLLGPTKVIPVANSSIFSVGCWVTIKSNITSEWVSEHGESAWNGQQHFETLGGLAYRRQVVAVGPNSITVDVPTRYAVRAARDGGRVVRNAVNPTFGVEKSGVEYLSIGTVQRGSLGDGGWEDNDYSNSSKHAWHVHGSYAIMMIRARDCWIREVNSYKFPGIAAGNIPGNTIDTHVLSNGIGISDSARITVRKCNFQRPQYGGAGGNGYMYRVTNSEEVLVEECTANTSRHGFVLSSMRSSGNVFLKCTDTKTGKQVGGGTVTNTGGAGNDHHQHFSHSNLIDACKADESYFTATYRPFGGGTGHNITAAHSVFWNTEGDGDEERWGPVVRTEQSRYGYVIGTRGDRSSIALMDNPNRPQMLPQDIYEGPGEGNKLSPFSLYEEQLERRLSQ